MQVVVDKHKIGVDIKPVAEIDPDKRIKPLAFQAVDTTVIIHGGIGRDPNDEMGGGVLGESCLSAQHQNTDIPVHKINIESDRR